jgi:hypothetical protein
MPITALIRQFSMLMGLPVVFLLCGAAALIVIARDWRLVLFAFGIVSAALALLMAQAIPTEWALLQAIAGGLVAVMLFLSGRQLRGAESPRAAAETRWPQLSSMTSFRVLAVALAGVAFVLVHETVTLPGVGALMRDAILWLGLMGLIGLALHEEPLHAGLALLLILGGFNLLLFHLTQSRVTVGLMESWQLLLGLAISYLTVSRGLAVSELVAPEGEIGRRF